MQTRTAAAGLLFALVTTAAAAADRAFSMPLAPLAPYATGVVVVGPSFLDRWSFDAPALAVAVSGSVISLDSQSLNIDGLQLDLYTAAGAPVASAGPGELARLEGVPLTSGASYYFEVSGATTGAAAGYYTFSAVTAPVPEPATAALWLAGAVVLGGLARRRR